jgi:hypothetical protein
MRVCACVRVRAYVSTYVQFEGIDTPHPSQVGDVLTLIQKCHIQVVNSSPYLGHTETGWSDGLPQAICTSGRKRVPHINPQSLSSTFCWIQYSLIILSFSAIQSVYVCVCVCTRVRACEHVCWGQGCWIGLLVGSSRKWIKKLVLLDIY